MIFVGSSLSRTLNTKLLDTIFLYFITKNLLEITKQSNNKQNTKRQGFSSLGVSCYT